MLEISVPVEGDLLDGVSHSYTRSSRMIIPPACSNRGGRHDLGLTCDRVRGSFGR